MLGSQELSADLLAASQKSPSDPANSESSEPTVHAAALEVLQLAFELAKSSSIPEACELALKKLLAVTGCQAGGVIKIDGMNKESKSDRGKMPESAHVSISVLAASELAGKAYHPISDTIVQNLLRDPSAILARNVTSDPSLIGDPEQTGSHVLSTTSLIAAPIQVDGNLYGVMHLYSRIGRKDLAPSDLEVALAVSEVLSVSIGNLLKHQSLETKLQSTSSRLEQLEQRLGHGDWIGDSQSIPMARAAWSPRRRC
jgi:GAF domain-containing protein